MHKYYPRSETNREYTIFHFQEERIAQISSILVKLSAINTSKKNYYYLFLSTKLMKHWIIYLCSFPLNNINTNNRDEFLYVWDLQMIDWMYAIECSHFHLINFTAHIALDLRMFVEMLARARAFNERTDDYNQHNGFLLIKFSQNENLFSLPFWPVCFFMISIQPIGMTNDFSLPKINLLFYQIIDAWIELLNFDKFAILFRKMSKQYSMKSRMSDYYFHFHIVFLFFFILSLSQLYTNRVRAFKSSGGHNKYVQFNEINKYVLV